MIVLSKADLEFVRNKNNERIPRMSETFIIIHQIIA